MPAFIRNKKDEARWARAKEAAGESRGKAEKDFDDQDWGLTNHIYHKLTKSELSPEGADAAIERLNLIRDIVATSPEVFLFNQDLLSKTVETLSKIGGEDDEEDQGYDLQDHGYDDEEDQALGDEDLEGLSVVDDPFEDEDDEAGKWLREREVQPGKVPEAPAKTDAAPSEEPKEEIKEKRNGSYSDWKPHGAYTPEQKSQMAEYQKQGYSEREAERLAGAHKGPTDFRSALSHTIRPSQPSPKMLEEMKQLAGHWLDRADRHAKINADPEKNPQKYAAGKMMLAHEDKTRDYGKAYNDFLNSEDTKKLKGMERHKAIQNFKNNWKTENPEYHGNLLSGVSEAQKHYGEANQARAQSLDERMKHIMTGGQQEGAMSAQEAAQHVGGVKEDEGYSSSIIKDPSASFAQANPQLIEKLRSKLQPEQMDRFNRVQSARAAQGVGQPAKPKVIVRKPGGTGNPPKE